MLRRMALCLVVLSMASIFAADASQAQTEAEAAIRYHFPAEAEDAMVAIAACESGLGQDIYNPVYPYAYGILQETLPTAIAYGHNYDALADPYYAAYAAKQLWDDSGYAPWAASSWCHGYY